jgi:hypothetical protein
LECEKSRKERADRKRREENFRADAEKVHEKNTRTKAARAKKAAEEGHGARGKRQAA